ncbi:MAG: hypothetical protein JWQ61_4111 [Collimonas fungivorans]|nr:hypothetical protein [Collimonas fungivorans]
MPDTRGNACDSTIADIEFPRGSLRCAQAVGCVTCLRTYRGSRIITQRHAVGVICGRPCADGNAIDSRCRRAIAEHHGVGRRSGRAGCLADCNRLVAVSGCARHGTAVAAADRDRRRSGGYRIISQSVRTCPAGLGARTDRSRTAACRRGAGVVADRNIVATAAARGRAAAQGHVGGIGGIRVETYRGCVGAVGSRPSCSGRGAGANRNAGSAGRTNRRAAANITCLRRRRIASCSSGNRDGHCCCHRRLAALAARRSIFGDGNPGAKRFAVDGTVNFIHERLDSRCGEACGMGSD